MRDKAARAVAACLPVHAFHQMSEGNRLGGGRFVRRLLALPLGRLCWRLSIKFIIFLFITTPPTPPPPPTTPTTPTT